MTQSKSKEIAHRVVDELWNNGHPDTLEELYAEDLTLRIPGAEFEGRDGIRRFIGMYDEAFPDLHIDILEYFPNESDTGGVAHWRSTGTHEGNLMGLEPTGNQMKVEGMTMSKIENGKIVEEVVLWDRLQQLEQLGVSPDELKRYA